MPSYLFNVQNTIEIVADNLTEALKLIGTDKAVIKEEDILLLEVNK